MSAKYWADDYVVKRHTAKEAIDRIKPGQRIFIGSSCGAPQHLVRTLFYAARRLSGLEIVRLFSMENAPLALVAHQSHENLMNLRSFYTGSAKTRGISKMERYLTPINLSEVPRLFKTRRLPLDVALIQVSPPDDFGWMSMGISVDITHPAALSADLVVAQVNSNMPKVLGNSFIHVNQVHVIVEHDEMLLTSAELQETDVLNVIAGMVSNLVKDGSTLQIDPGLGRHATLKALSEKNDLGIHTQYLTDPILHLVSKGVITNREKGYNEHKLVASAAVGSRNLYDFVDNNPFIEFHPSNYVNDPAIICRHNKMVSINMATTMDLSGQVAADALPHTHFSGITGMPEFMMGAVQADEGRAIVLLPSTSVDGKKSAIVPRLENTAVVVPRANVRHVVTEYGVVNLFGKSNQERAMAMISIAHPGYRDMLLHEARKMGLLGAERCLKKAVHAIYPPGIEETLEIGGQMVTIRPVKPVDDRRMQEHFYTLKKSDVISRFFQKRKSFSRSEIEGLSMVDYISDLTLVAVVGEHGFGKVVGVGGYLLEKEENRVEVHFTVSTEFQGKGLGGILLKKLADAALKNGIFEIVAYTSYENRRMIRLFQGLPYAVKTADDGGMLILSCKFDEKE